jgi:hypothetical protein
MNKWFIAQANPQLISPPAVKQNILEIPSTTPTPDNQIKKKNGIADVVRFLLRPFRRFTFLWCILLLVTTHIVVVWLCLIVVLGQLAQKIFGILKIVLFSDPLLNKIGSVAFAGLKAALITLSAVTSDAKPTNELKNLWGQLSTWKKILDFLKDPYLMSRWALVIGIIFFGSIYMYIAFLFSFAYYGIARVGGVHFPWPDALVASVFILFFISELPKLLAIEVLAGIQCVLVVGVGIGTIVNFLRRKLDSIRRAAKEYSDQLADERIQEKYSILEQKFSTTTSAPPAKNAET